MQKGAKTPFFVIQAGTFLRLPTSMVSKEQTTKPFICYGDKP
jgi:hypothetical protein